MSRLATFIEHGRQDLAYALRSLRRSPGFAAMVVATLALGVGANTALFSLADQLFLQTPNGVADPGSLRRLYARSDWSPGHAIVIRDVFGYPQFQAVSHSIAARAATAAYTPPDSMRVGVDGPPAQGVYASADFFRIVGAHTSLGRVFGPEDDHMGSGMLVAVISYAYWQHHFGGDPTIIGRVVPIARQQYTIIGVTQRGFDGVDLDPVDVWLPLATYPSPEIGRVPWYESWRSGWQIRVLARVRNGTPNDWLSSAATVAFDRGEIANVTMEPDTAAVVVGPIQAALGPAIPPRPEVAITTRLMGVALIVLLIACANVTNLLLSRANARRREIAVRLALGVSRARLVAQLLTEGAVLSVAAGAIAVVIGVWGAFALRHSILPAGEEGSAWLDWRMTGVALALALVTGLLASLTPALRASRPDLTSSLKSGARAGIAVEHAAFRVSLVLVQASLSVVLLVGAGLFVRSYASARSIDIGFDADRLVYATVYFADPQGHYVKYFDRGHMVEVTDGLRHVAARMRMVPGVQSTALAASAPMRGYAMVRLFLEGGRPAPEVNGIDPTINAATPDYFRTAGVNIVRGRLFDAGDKMGTEPVAVVNETAARAYWPGRDPLGQCIMMNTASAPCTRVIGVMHDVHLFDLVEKPIANAILPVAQQPDSDRFANPSFLIVRAAPREIGPVASALRRAVRDQFPTAEPPFIETSTGYMHRELTPWRLGALLFTVFGVLALVVGAIGVFSVLAYSVSQRTHEMGVRMALGARDAQVMSLVIGEGVRVVLAGVALGVAASLALGRLVASMLYGTSPHDPIVLASVAVLLTAVSVVASAVPAWRASRTDPVIALRAD